MKIFVLLVILVPLVLSMENPYDSGNGKLKMKNKRMLPSTLPFMFLNTNDVNRVFMSAPEVEKDVSALIRTMKRKFIFNKNMKRIFMSAPEVEKDVVALIRTMKRNFIFNKKIKRMQLASRLLPHLSRLEHFVPCIGILYFRGTRQLSNQ